MMAFLDGEIKDVFILLVRVVAAVVGALVGWFVTGPIAQLLARVAFHRQLSPLALVWSKLIGAVVVGLLVFWLLPIGGWDGGGGGGKGGGKGKGAGPYTNGSGTGKGNPSDLGKTGKFGGDGTGADKDKGARKVLEIEVLGLKSIKESNKIYKLDRQDPPLSWEQLEAHILAHQQEIASITIVSDPTTGVTEDRDAVKNLVKLAKKLKIPTLVNID
jgi:hypothetical protein